MVHTLLAPGLLGTGGAIRALPHGAIAPITAAIGIAVARVAASCDEAGIAPPVSRRLVVLVLAPIAVVKHLELLGVLQAITVEVIFSVQYAVAVNVRIVEGPGEFLVVPAREVIIMVCEAITVRVGVGLVGMPIIFVVVRPAVAIAVCIKVGFGRRCCDGEMCVCEIGVKLGWRAARSSMLL